MTDPTTDLEPPDKALLPRVRGGGGYRPPATRPCSKRFCRDHPELAAYAREIVEMVRLLGATAHWQSPGTSANGTARPRRSRTPGPLQGRAADRRRGHGRRV